MACCKDKKERLKEIVETETLPEKSFLGKTRDYAIKSVLFLVLSVVVVPILIPISIVVLFRMVVLSKNINLLPLVTYIATKLFTKDDEDEDDDEDDDDIDEDDYELENPEEIIVLNQN